MVKKLYPTYSQSIWLLLMLIPFTMVGVVILMIFHLMDDTVALSIVYTLSLGLTIWWGLKNRKSYSFKRAPFSISMLLVTFLLLMSFHFVTEPVLDLLPQPEGLIKMMTEMAQYPALMFLTLVLLGPILEELLFRGIILDGYLKNYSPLMSALVSGFLFALVHGNLTQGVGAFFMGLVVGLLYWRVRSLIFCILLHMLINFVAFLGMIFSTPEELTKTTRDTIGNDQTYFIVYAVSCIVCVACGWYLWNTYIKPEQPLLTQKPLQPVAEEVIVPTTEA